MNQSQPLHYMYVLAADKESKTSFLHTSPTCSIPYIVPITTHSTSQPHSSIKERRIWTSPCDTRLGGAWSRRLAVFPDPGSATGQQQPGHRRRARGTTPIPASWAALKSFLLWTAGLLVFPCRGHRALRLGRCLGLSFYLRLHLSF